MEQLDRQFSEIRLDDDTIRTHLLANRLTHLTGVCFNVAVTGDLFVYFNKFDSLPTVHTAICLHFPNPLWEYFQCHDQCITLAYAHHTLIDEYLHNGEIYCRHLR